MGFNLVKNILVICIFSLLSFNSFAQQDFENLLDSKEWHDLVSKGTVYLETGTYDRAMEYFQKVATTYPYIAEAQYYLGFVYYKKGDYNNAEKIFKRAIKLDSAYLPALYYLGLIYYEKEDNETAIEYFDKVVRNDPSFQSAYYNMGVSYIKLQQPVNAIREFAYAVYLEPTDETALEALVHVYAIKKKGVTVQKAKTLGVNKTGEDKKTIVDKSDVSDEAEKAVVKFDVEISLLNPGKKRVFLSEGTEEIELISRKGKSGFIEINFIEPADLKDINVFMNVRGAEGTERIKVAIKDVLTRACPKFYVKGITASWNTIKVDIGKNAYMYVDTDRVKKIRLELVPPQGENPGDKTSVFIKDIEIKKQRKL